MTDTDLTFSKECRFASALWVATRLGMSVDTFYKKCKTLQKHGFPARDPLTNRYPKDDVDAWINARQRSHAKVEVTANRGINFDGI